MNIEYFIIGILTFILVSQQVYWARICYQLTNRIMSRNYAELRQAEAKPTVSRPVKDENAHDPFAENQAKELNSLFGMV